jgi:hypothetical protein
MGNHAEKVKCRELASEKFYIIFGFLDVARFVAGAVYFEQRMPFPESSKNPQLHK